VRGAVSAFGGVAAWQPRLQIGFGIHQIQAGCLKPLRPSHPVQIREPETRHGLKSNYWTCRAIDFQKSYGQKAALTVAGL
jgi:hypothetical protein